MQRLAAANAYLRTDQVQLGAVRAGCRCERISADGAGQPAQRLAVSGATVPNDIGGRPEQREVAAVAEVDGVPAVQVHLFHGTPLRAGDAAPAPRPPPNPPPP